MNKTDGRVFATQQTEFSIMFFALFQVRYRVMEDMKESLFNYREVFDFNEADNIMNGFDDWLDIKETSLNARFQDVTLLDCKIIK